MTDQLHAASRPFPQSYIMSKQGASYVEHSVVSQRMLEVFGFYDIMDVEPIRGHVPAWVDKRDESKNKPPLEDAVTGVLLTIRVHLDNGEHRIMSEVGEVEFPHNHTTDASRAKHATSDAIKRCAMRLGIGLHLWAQGHYYLDKSMDKRMANHVEGKPDDDMPEAPDPEAKPVTEPAAEEEPEEREEQAISGGRKPPTEELTEEEELTDVVNDLLAAFPSEFVGTLDLDKLYPFATSSRDNLTRAIDTVEERFTLWEQEQVEPPAPGFYFHHGGGHYDLFDRDMRPEDKVRGKDNVPKGYVELEEEPAVEAEVVEEGNDQPPAPFDGSLTFEEHLAEYPEEFRQWLVDEGVGLEAMIRLAGKSDEHKANALKIIGNRWREFSGESSDE